MKLKNISSIWGVHIYVVKLKEKEHDKHIFRIVFTLREEIKGQGWGRAHKEIIMIYFKRWIMNI